MDATTYDIVLKFFGAYAVFIIATGTICNLICCALSLKPKLIKTPTFVILAFNTITESIGLYTYPMKIFVMTYYRGQGTLEDKNAIWCIIQTWIQPFAQYASAWLLVILTRRGWGNSNIK